MSAHTTHPSFDDFLARSLRNPETRAAYEDSQSRHRIVDALIRLRNLLNLTQTDVARSMGIKQPAVSGFETEGSDPRLSTLQRYARSVDATLWVRVIPNAATTQRVDFYCQHEGLISTVAHHAEMTERAATWAASGQPYRRRLSAVPDSVPA